MQAIAVKFLIQLLLTLGDLVIKEGSEYYREWNDLRNMLAKAVAYQKVVDDPNASREDREKAEDELGS